ncbi:MAG: AI-2E family transporter [Treponema sp.]|jgi:predicted PurR-regulated permease PerM|nr:AI-2E family transporter [Treponema sp.]
MSEPNPPPEERQIQNVVFIVILVLLFLVVARVFAPFFTVLLWSSMFYVMLSPLHRRLVSKINFNKRSAGVFRSLLAVAFAIGSVLLILIPLLFVIWQVFKQAVELMKTVQDSLYTNPAMLTDIFVQVADFVKEISADQIILDPHDIQHRIVSLLSSSLQTMFQFSSSLTKNVGSFLFNIVLMVFSLFFFYIDGPYLSQLFLHVIPIRKDYLSALVNKFSDITRNLVLGYIMVAMVQALMGFIVFSIFQVKGALVFAVLTFVCVFIPMVGGSLVWFPLGLVRVINGDLVGGIIFWIVSAILISFLDNFIRPMFLQDRIQLHPLIIFFSILGGLSVFKLNGLILGPMVVILFLTVLDLFLTEHKMANSYKGEDK